MLKISLLFSISYQTLNDKERGEKSNFVENKEASILMMVVQVNKKS